MGARVRKIVELEEDQLKIVEELKSLLNKMRGANIRTIVDSYDASFNFINERNLNDLGLETDCVFISECEETDRVIEWDYMKSNKMPVDVISSDDVVYVIK